MKNFILMKKGPVYQITEIFGHFYLEVAVLACLFLILLGCSLLFAADLPNKQIHAVIFDCDGVLVDTEYLKFLAWKEALEIQNVPFTIEEHAPLVGHSSKNIHQMICKNKQLQLSDEIIRSKNAKYKIFQKEGVQPIQPVVEFASFLFKNKKKLGFKMALVSSAPKDEIWINLCRAKLEHVFDVVVSGSDDLAAYSDIEGTNKPKPYVYTEASKRLDINPEHCLVFEDTKAGIDAAANAGMIAIALPNRFTINQDFSNAHRVLTSYNELSSFDILKNLNRKERVHYTIVLTPSVGAEKYVEASLTYAEYQPSYLLNARGSSSPHITVVQFDCDSLEIAQMVWTAMCEKMLKEKFESFIPSFTGMSFIEGTGPYAGTTWIELSVKKGDVDSPIMRVHNAAITSLDKFNLQPLNAAGSNYRPHLTLARIVMPKHMSTWSNTLFENPGNFKLEFGISDEKWQYAECIDAFSNSLQNLRHSP